MALVTLADVLALAAEAGRICPKPDPWTRLYALLPETRRDGYGAIPAAPLVLDAWSATGDEQKLERLREHLAWAEQHGALERVHDYLASLRESDWHHVGE